ncbi:CHAT domain-containing protein [Rhizoctonia solani]|nr:CHAT domain-containing protein [Rhizoctonia solani]
MRNVAIEAASVALRDGQPELALEWLEQGRSIVWNQTLHLRSPLDGLRAHHPTLAEKLQNVRSELHNVSLQGPESLPGSGDWLTPEHAARRRHLLATEYTNLISEVQQLPGFSHFLRPKPASELILAARRGTVVVINVHETQCDALVIRPGSPKIDFLNLPNFTQQRAHDMCMHMEASIGRSGIKERTERRPIQSGQDIQRDLKHTLSVLWDYIVEPVLRLLGYIATTPEQLPHITWCTTGPLSFIPLHAAGYYDRPECKLSDYAVSSYTPTLSALIALDLTPSDHRSIIAIGQEITPDSVVYLLTESNATPAAVLEQMERHDWVHLACHAHQNITDPRMSGFFLHGGILDLSKITEKEFTNKGLAFLSACQTATGDRKLADEAVHLASGLLIAGYPAVIATMWAVGDSDASFVANKIYQNLFKDGKMEYQGAARALHYAIVELREEIGEDRIECWAPFIHIGSY